MSERHLSPKEVAERLGLVDQASSGVFERYKAGKPLRLAKRPTATPTPEVQG